MKTNIASSITLSLLASFASAQYVIDPNSVANSTRDAWCSSQEAQCPLICLQTNGNTAETISNACDPSILTYSCVCSNGLSPNITEYSQTMPYFVCTEWGTQCVSNCNGNTDCQSACRQDHPCGALSPTRVNVTSTSSTMTSTASGSALAAAGATTDSSGATIYTGYGGASVTSLPNGAEPGSKAAESSGSGAAGAPAAATKAAKAIGIFLSVSFLVGSFAFWL